MGELECVGGVQASRAVLKHDRAYLLLALECRRQEHGKCAGQQANRDNFKYPSPSVMVDVVHTQVVEVFHDLVKECPDYSAEDADKDEEEVVDHVVVSAKVSRGLLKLNS